MVVKGSVHGLEELRHVRTLLDVTGPQQLKADLLDGTRRAVAPLKADLKAEALVKMPKRGGYAALLARSMRVTTRVTGGAKVRAVVDVTAKGKGEVRDLAARNRGELRHPVFGRYRMTKHGPMKNPWHLQRVRPGVVDRPVDRLRDRVVDNARDAADKFADTIAHG